MDRFLTWGVVLLIACVSLVPFRFLAFAPPFGNVANYLPLLLTLILVSVLMLLRREIFLAMLKRDVLLGAIVAFVVADLLGSVGGVNSMHSLSRSVYYFLTGPLIYWVVSCGFRGVGQTRLLLITVSAFSGLAALYGISEYASGGSWLYQSTLSIANPKFLAATGGAEFIGRVLGTLGHPVAFGAFLLLTRTSPFDRSDMYVTIVATAAMCVFVTKVIFDWLPAKQYSCPVCGEDFGADLLDSDSELEHVPCGAGLRVIDGSVVQE